MSRCPIRMLKNKVPMRDGINLSVDVYLRSDGGTFPALLALSAYGKKGMTPGLALSADVPPTIEHGHTERLLEDGYAHIVGDVRGTGESEGRYTLWGRQEQEDCYDLIEWIARQPWCDRNVGMIGISYFAMLQVPAAALQPPHLKAILPFEPAGADLYRDWFYQGGLLNRQFLLAWSQFVAAPARAPLSFDEFSSAELAERIAYARQLPEFDGDAVLQGILDEPSKNPIVFDALMHTEDGEFYWERSSTNKYKQVLVPTYFGTWGNVNFIDALGAFRGFQQIASANKKLIVGPPVFPDRPSWQYAGETERWYGRWLKGEPTGVEKEPPLCVYVTGANRWRSSSIWPLSDTRWTRFYLHATGWLHEYPPTAEEGSTQFEFRPDAHTGVVFETSVLLEDIEMVGPLSLHLAASCSTDDTAWIASLYDVFPDERRYLIARGWLKASHRRTDPDRSTPWQPYHPHRDRSPIDPRAVHDYAIELLPVTNMFRVGHRMALEISCDDRGLAANGRGWLASVLPTERKLIDQLMLERFFTPHAVDRRPKTLAVHHSAEHASYLLAPIVSGNIMGTSSYMRVGNSDVPKWMG